MHGRTLFFVFVLLSSLQSVNAQVKTIHIFVALCDNENQGIVKVPASLGNGQDPATNLFWGATFGVRSFFKNRTSDWEFVKSLEPENPIILDRVLFKHISDSIYILAEAYDGALIKTCIENFLKAANGQNPMVLEHERQSLPFGGGADLLAYVGHDGLMDFDIEVTYQSNSGSKKDVIILACYSMRYFYDEIQRAGANPILWTTHLMAPEAYTLNSAIDGWMNGESGYDIEERAAQVYHKYQQCGINGARNLFISGF